MLSKELDNSLEDIWNAAMDWSNWPDFQSLPDDEREASYIRYKANIIAKAKTLINQSNVQALEAFTDRVVAHWEPMDDEDLTVEGATTDVFNELNSYQENKDVK